MSQKFKMKDCFHCQESFEAKRKNHRYCSASCRVLACYKRKGYTYVSGHYHKPQSASSGDVLPIIPKTGPGTGISNPQMSASAVPSTQDSAVRRSDEVSAAGVKENVIGSGLVAAGMYLLHDRPMMELIKELHEVLVAMPKRLQQQQDQETMKMGMGMMQPNALKQATANPAYGVQPSPKPNKPSPLTPHQLNMQRMGLDPNLFKEKDDGMMLM